jgi:hypothetical protein
MIRISDGQTAFGDAHDYFHNERNTVSPWLKDAARAAVGVTLVSVAIGAVQKRVGQNLVEAEKLAIGWIARLRTH